MSKQRYYAARAAALASPDGLANDKPLNAVNINHVQRKPKRAYCETFEDRPHRFNFAEMAPKRRSRAKTRGNLEFMTQIEAQFHPSRRGPAKF